ncbi:MAG: tetratricopeptide repeat protein [Bacteroidaceae bacterium]|nr:tetratricopeptide repeat protein [Bacteroides sp.]MBR4043962.1 tetratricopeptide repeat protein [Bacteroidaceae bacterium]
MADKKQTQDPLDLEVAMSSSEAFIIKYKNKFLAGIAAIVIVVGGVLGYQHFIAEPNEKKASEALFKGEQYFMADNYEFALNGDSLGYEGFLKVADEFSGTDAGQLANAYAGICYAQLGQYENAVKFLDKFNADDQLVSPALMGTLGNCYAQLGQLDKGAATLMKAADKADSQALSPIYLIQAGQIYEKLGKKSEALSAYQTVKDKYFNSYHAMEIDKYIERASVK